MHDLDIKPTCLKVYLHTENEAASQAIVTELKENKKTAQGQMSPTSNRP